MTEKFKKLLDDANSIVIIQGDNPDADSLASMLALDNILADKQVHMLSMVAIPKHLRHLAGWDRVESEIPKDFDLTIAVDGSKKDIFAKALEDGKLAKKPFIILDHHDAESDIEFDTVNIIDPSVASTGELIFKLSKDMGWEISKETASLLATSIMYDTLGLSSVNTTSSTIRSLADLVDIGADLAAIENDRRSSMKRSQELTEYKGRLLQRIEYFHEGQVATIGIPWEEIEEYSPHYNPPMLIFEDMRMTEGVKVVIAFKYYPDKVTGKIRANHGSPIAAKLAEAFGGGGHEYSSGFKVMDRQRDVKSEVLKKLGELL